VCHGVTVSVFWSEIYFVDGLLLICVLVAGVYMYVCVCACVRALPDWTYDVRKDD
jgi:hypothetical protein